MIQDRMDHLVRFLFARTRAFIIDQCPYRGQQCTIGSGVDGKTYLCRGSGLASKTTDDVLRDPLCLDCRIAS